MNQVKVILFLFLAVAIAACSSSEMYIDRSGQDWQEELPPPPSELLYKMYLIGDAGAPSLDKKEPVLKLLKTMADKEKERSAVVFLGDNLYPAGLPDSAAEDRNFAEKRLKEQLDAVKDFKGRVIVIPGNHDWNDGKPGGLDAVRRQEQFVEEYLDRGNTFLPDNGFPGPVEIELMDDDDDPRLRDDIRLVIIDTQWWLHKHEKPFGDTGEYELNDAGDFLNQMEEIMRDRKNDFVTVLAHHPMFSNARHGGRLPLSTHIKPPVFGSLYVLYRRFLGLEQDINHHTYKELRNGLLEILSQKEDLFYVSGHDHNLQYIPQKQPRKTQHYIISGSGSKTGYVANGRGSEFSYEKEGFVTLQFYGNGSVWAEFWAPEGDGSNGQLLFRTQLKGPYADPLAVPEEEIEEPEEVLTEAKDSVTMAANPWYDRHGRIARFFVGAHNRDFWSVPVTAPVFDLDDFDNGLKPVRLGGKGQSNTLHLETDSGQDYVLRSVDKVAGKVWNPNLRRTVALDIAQDQFSIINPYAAFIIPPLAEAVDIYHTKPKLYYVPKDPALGEYANQVGGEFALFEERPNGDMSDFENMGRSKEVLSHQELMIEVDGDFDHRVDQYLMARSRLFDMWLSDWDRHSDQWRWGSFEPKDEKGKIYKPIPRDRDVALMKFNRLPSLAKYGPFFQYQDFREHYGSLKGLTRNALGLTRRFTNQITKEEWIAIADSMKNELTDEVIRDAVADWPSKVYEEFGEETIRLFKIRRDKLPQVAEEYYYLLSKVVSVPASHKREEFVVERLDEKRTYIKVYKLDGDGERKRHYFERTFYNDETSEIRLYGMGDDDMFNVSGDDDNGIKVLIIGGPGDDVINTPTSKPGSSNIHIFDTYKGTTLNVGPKTKTALSSSPTVNKYDLDDDFKYNSTLPVLFFGGNSDAGIFIGGGTRITTHKFRRDPASVHVIKGNVAPKVGAFNLVYDAEWLKRSSNSGYALEMDILFPENFRNFFGLGNETERTTRNIEFYRAELGQVRVKPSFQLKQFNYFDLSIGPKLLVTEVERDQDGFLNEPQAGIADDTFKDQWFTGLSAEVNLKDVDNPANPRQGFDLSFQSDLNIGIRNTSEDFAKLEGDIKLYFSPSFVPQITIANRIGGAHNIGPFPFYEANTLGSVSNLRGFRSTRFSGRSSMYHNIEVRAELFSVYKYLLAGRLGVNAFLDTGRVWTDGESSNIWHQGYGGGIWFDFLDAVIINADVGFSDEGNTYNLGLGFFF